MIKEHLEIAWVNTIIFLFFESYSDGKLFEVEIHNSHFSWTLTLSGAFALHK